MPVEIKELIIRTHLHVDPVKPENFEFSEADKQKILEAAQKEVVRQLKAHNKR